MDKADRNKIINPIKRRNQEYLAKISTFDYCDHFEQKFKNLTRKTQFLLRKERESENSIKHIPKIARIVAGFIQDIRRRGAPSYDFTEYFNILNHYLIGYLENKRTTKYEGKCASYGETLLVLYLDIFIAATVYKPDKKLQVHPPYLINPKTGSVLEIDVLLEDFHLAFEFQGEHHYTDAKVEAKDKFKLQECYRRGRILIPVNIVQLESNQLQILIVNSIKDFLSLNDIFTDKRDTFRLESSTSLRQLTNFCKVAERLHLSSIVFAESMKWLDDKAEKYKRKMQARSPISSTRAAPRQMPTTVGLDIDFIYRRLKHVSEVGKRLKKCKR